MKADWTTYSGRSLCPIPRKLPSNENNLDDRPERTGRLFLLACRVCVYRYFPASHWLLYVPDRTILRERIGRSVDLLCVASVALPVPCASRRYAPLVRRTEIGHHGIVVHHAGDNLAGDSRKIPRKLVVPDHCAGPDVPDCGDGRIPGTPGSGPNFGRVRRQFSHGGRLSCHHL